MSIQRTIVLFGDEIGLRCLKESLRNKKKIRVAFVIYSYKRNITEAAADIARELECEALMQPKRDDVYYTDFLDQLKESGAETGICFSYDLIIHKEVLDLFPMGIFNLHGALLPRNRGANVLNWVLINGETETGMTIHQMNEGIDAGPIVLQKKVEIAYEDTAVSLRDKLAQAAMLLLEKFWEMYCDNTIMPVSQDEKQATYLKRRTEEDGFFDWNWETEKIYNLIRGLVKPWPGAWYMDHGKKCVIDEYLTIEQVNLLKEKYQHKE